MIFDHHFVSFLIRWIHVISMALIMGGASLLWGFTIKPTGSSKEREPMILLTAERYECIFWGAVGLLVITGVGNLGALGNALPNRLTPWGGKITIKLTAVFFFLLLSMLRTLLVVRFSLTGSGTASISLSKSFQLLYAGTALYLAATLLLAVALAHY